jgi:hypothetical protein
MSQRATTGEGSIAFDYYRPRKRQAEQMARVPRGVGVALRDTAIRGVGLPRRSC